MTAEDEIGDTERAFRADPTGNSAELPRAPTYLKGRKLPVITEEPITPSQKLPKNATLQKFTVEVWVRSNIQDPKIVKECVAQGYDQYFDHGGVFEKVKVFKVRKTQ